MESSIPYNSQQRTKLENSADTMYTKTKTEWTVTLFGLATHTIFGTTQKNV